MDSSANPFIHLHVHSNFSFLDGGSHIEDIVARASALGQPALALTDHNGLYGAVRFARACAKWKVKPIFGAEVQVEAMTPQLEAMAPQPATEHPSHLHPYHLVLLAETREGYANLCQLVSAAHLADPGRSRPPVVSIESLRSHASGLICLTGCRCGEIGYLVDAGRIRQAQLALQRLQEIFDSDHLYVELQYFAYQPQSAAVSSSLPSASLHSNSNATIIATDSRNSLTRLVHLNPADYDIGFYPDGEPWRLSCLVYCQELARLAASCGLRTVLTTNVHYAKPDDLPVHLVCRAAGRDQPLSGYPEPRPGVRHLWSQSDLIEFAQPLFRALAPEERVLPLEEGNPLLGTWEIAERCNVDLELGVFHFPKVPLPEGETAYSLLAKRCFKGIARRYRPVPPEAIKLLEKELCMIQEMGFAHYFLVVHDIVRWARARGIPCSGRGSAGNSIVCYALGITASDPLRHNLLFERFLNPYRREMPDIDVDFCSVRRDEVIEHIYKTFGPENVAVVANVNTMSPRTAVRIVAEALGFSPSEINALARNVPRHGNAARIREYLAGGWPELCDSPLQDSAPPAAAPDGTTTPGGRYWRFLDLVERLDSFPLHLGTHLGGFVIADRPITYYAPLQWAAKGVVITQFNKDDIAALGLVKMDILGLRTHSAVAECVRLIRERTGRVVRPYELPTDDPAAYEIIRNGGSIGLFQLESPGQRNLATRLKEENFNDIIAAIALYRPGPLEAEMITPFVERRWGRAPVTVPHPAMAEAVADTYGVILYQEQVLRIAQAVAGFDLAEADLLRRAMTRDRSREEMARIGEDFVARAVARGVPEEAAREVFRQLEGFAAYGFNKSHAVCFAVIAYATAWLKAHYPAEYLCAVLNNQPMGFYSPRVVLNDARRFGLKVRPLDINFSGRGFIVEDAESPAIWNADGTPTSYNPFAPPRSAAGPGRALRVGFSYLKHMSERALTRIEEERRRGPFESFEDFYLRTRVEYPVAENLIRVGAFDSLEPDRTELLWRLPLLHERLETLGVSGKTQCGQLRVFSSPPLRTGLKREWSLKDKVRAELELLGLSVTCHPLALYEAELRELGVTMSYELPILGDEVPVIVAGMYERAQNPWMRSGKRTMFLTLEDAYGLFECVCFESKLPKIAPVVARANYFLVKGRLQNNPRRGLAIVAEEVLDLEEALTHTGRAKSYLPRAALTAAPCNQYGARYTQHPRP